MLENLHFRLGFSTIVVFTFLAGDAWRLALGWWVFGALAIALTLVSGWSLWRQRNRWGIAGLPFPLLVFLTLATTSILWSNYPGATAIGLVTTWIIVVNAIALAITFTWTELLRALGVALRVTIGLSLLFELFVSVVVRERVLPFFGLPGIDYGSYDHIPGMLMWSRNQLFDVFDEGRIQGIVGNANSLGFLALLALVVFSIQLASRTVSKLWGVAWLGVAIATLLMTKSATVTLAAAAVLLVLIVALVVRRAKTTAGRAAVYLSSVALLGGGAVAGFLLRDKIFEILGKSSDLTGRLGIWEKLGDLIQQRPAFGWGWVSFWVPWAEPFDNLAFSAGVRQLQAHNTWLDVTFQLGLVGLLVFVALVGAALIKSWQHAVDRPQRPPGAPLTYSAVTLLPLLVLVALVVQSFAESRLITEYGLALLVVVAVKTKRRELL